MPRLTDINIKKPIVNLANVPNGDGFIAKLYTAGHRAAADMCKFYFWSNSWKYSRYHPYIIRTRPRPYYVGLSRLVHERNRHVIAMRRVGYASHQVIAKIG
jgi:hypothetical protein